MIIFFSPEIQEGVPMARQWKRLRMKVRTLEGGLRRGDEIISFGTLTLYLTLVMFIKVSHMKYDV